MTHPGQSGGQQLPVCENGHPMTTVDGSCPLCGAKPRPGGASSAFPAEAAGPSPGFSPPPSTPPPGWPGQGGYQQEGYQQGGYGPGRSGSFQGSPGGPAGGPAFPDPAATQGDTGIPGIPVNPAYSAQPGGYQQAPGPGYWQRPVYPPAAKTNVLAIVSLVAGIIWFFWIGSVVALICGLIALGQIRARGENGRGIAIAGIILAGLGMVTLVLVIAVSIAISNGHVSPATPSGP